MFIPGRKTVSGLCLNQEPDKNIQASIAKGPTNGKESQIVTLAWLGVSQYISRTRSAKGSWQPETGRVNYTCQGEVGLFVFAVIG